jgi:hypothetical protein
MPYRASLEAQRMRCDLLERELAELRLRASAMAETLRELDAKEREVAAAKTLLAGMGAKRPLPVLDALRIASPCKARWEEMVGDDRVRFCGQCSKNVYNLSAMSRADAEDLVQAKESNLCARMVQRSDGTVITGDCPVGARKKRIRRTAITVVSGGLIASGILSASTARLGGGHSTVMGGISVGHPVTQDTPPSVAPTPLTPLVPHEALGHTTLGTVRATK